jgi:hypothetical protein
MDCGVSGIPIGLTYVPLAQKKVCTSTNNNIGISVPKKKGGRSWLLCAS